MQGKPSLEELLARLDQLEQRHSQFQSEIVDLRIAISKLQEAEEAVDIVSIPPVMTTENPPGLKQEELAAPLINVPPFAAEIDQHAGTKAKKEKTPLEEFIGTNLLNKIGIAVVVVGVGIGAEYAIDQGLISPVMRIVLGYLCGIALIGVAIRLKAQYENFSAVLLSGGMAVLYFITFAAYDLYQLFPQSFAFVLMVLFTAFTVFAALQYNLQVIAVIGFIGAYGVPFLLSNGSGNVVILFSYMTIINSGILFLSFKKFWKILYYVAFGLTWLIFATWYVNKYDEEGQLWTVLIFSTLFFTLFYASILAYKLIRSENLTRTDVTLVLVNSFVYFGFGYFAIEAHPNGETFLGLFTLFNAILHFIVCLIIFKSQAQSRDIFLFTAGLVLVFLTLAVPVQLEGNWVTIIWAAEAALLFWLGRTKNYPGYEKLSYPLVVLALGSLAQDWSRFYGPSYIGLEKTHIRTFFNVQLLASLMTCGALGWIVKLSHNKKYPSPLKEGYIGNDLLLKGLPVILIAALYFTFYFEVNTYWHQRFIDSQLSAHSYGHYDFIADYDVLKFKTIWLINYSAIFVLILGLVNLFRLKNNAVAYAVFGLATFVLFILITVGLVEASDLRYSYLHQTNATYYFRDIGHLLIRYVCIGLALGLLWINYKSVRAFISEQEWHKAERVIFHFAILSFLSSELVGGLALIQIVDSDKLALSILWGSYALGLIVLGLMKDQKYIRITAIVLFGVTLIKLFFYDMSGMGTISKTVVMIILGVLLLVASFLYNKFNKKKEDENK
jgi:uncharacterized membrane protein